jgi:hypothetical protein
LGPAIVNIQPILIPVCDRVHKAQVLKDAQKARNILGELLPQSFLKHGLQPTELADPDTLLGAQTDNLSQLLEL